MNPLLVSLLLPGLLMTTPEPASSPVPAFARLPLEQRRAELKTLTRERLVELFATTPVEVLLDAGKAAAAQMGTYESRVVKSERVSGKQMKPQTLHLTVRQSPRAVRLEILEGPAKGRRVVYDSTVKKNELRVREAGVLGLAGPMWIDVNSELTRSDTNHPIMDFAFTSIIGVLEDSFKKGEPLGGYTRKDEGFDTSGRYCITFTAPAGGKHLYAARARICMDPLLALPVVMEIDDAQGPLERFTFNDVKPVAKADFSPSSI
ncbi:uncharacterized protein DUF1571 [Archangium gephyra]|uniref:LIPOPROTEIN transmembrane n=1 Tax=Archangium gephyra TaxID=48 RepID=A0AAC8Q481_9BACT|nr:DUF1571 domain-containing protein [Archangium gephyra]AKJ00813.1 Putative LIPOPROTEIN transmembrane [Archangium gephyra]REG25981.1 uncharacterized protein DUF1571 [Archangium gephyra]